MSTIQSFAALALAVRTRDEIAWVLGYGGPTVVLRPILGSWWSPRDGGMGRCGRIWMSGSVGWCWVSRRPSSGAGVRGAVRDARDGVLFIDEAYALTASGPRDVYVREALITRIDEMERQRDRLVVVLAGYPEEMGSFWNPISGWCRGFAIAWSSRTSHGNT